MLPLWLNDFITVFAFWVSLLIGNVLRGLWGA